MREKIRAAQHMLQDGHAIVPNYFVESFSAQLHKRPIAAHNFVFRIQQHQVFRQRVHRGLPLLRRLPRDQFRLFQPQQRLNRRHQHSGVNRMSKISVGAAFKRLDFAFIAHE